MPWWDEILLVSLTVLLTLWGTWFKEHRHRPRLERGVREDIERLAGRLAGLPFLIALKKGGLTKPLMNWVVERLERYPDGEFDTQHARDAFEKFRNLDESQLAQIQTVGMATAGGDFDVKTYDLPYVQAHIDEIHLLPKEMRTLVMEIRASLSLFNQRVETARDLLSKALESLSPDNQRVVRVNLDATYQHLKDDAMWIVERIDTMPQPGGLQRFLGWRR